MKRDLYDLSVELTGISMIISGLSNQLDSRECDTLTPEALDSAMLGLARHIDRIAEDLMKLDK